DSAVVPSAPSSPNRTKNAMIGFVLGLAFSTGYVVLRELMDISVHTEEDISQSCKYPVLASVPDMESHSKGGSYYGYGKKHAYDKSPQKKNKKVELVGGSISFVAAESYKLLRTKLQFSFADEGECHIIGVSSAMAGEGKSLSAVNLAYSTSQLGKRVLLIDCDMRRPSLADKLPIKKQPGLSDYLTGQANAENLLQYCGIKNDAQAFHAISSGRTPPNPMELLSSARMERMLSQLRKNYDYIILDLPPVGEVGDAMAAAKLTDGMLIVVRQDYCNRIALNSAVRQFEFVDAKILGVVFNCIAEEGRGYYKKYYRRYYRRYYRKYGDQYAYVPKQAIKDLNADD
ncbi:MAG: polysaccharide biosynthesis tyrosine autokinase, partial [Oscillospiraceae bacterium]|nr:polysaccharide biosynthesis tyrosine autokinase [Oscillospiraceae bacterium]